MPDFDSQYPNQVSNSAIDLAATEVVQTPGIETATDAKALAYENPDYPKFAPKWAKYQDLYNSHDVYRYIHTHIRESAESFRKRVARGYYLNYVSSVVDLLVAYLYHSPLSRQPQNLQDIYEALYKDADRRGKTFQVFMQEVMTHALTSGHCGVLVDMPRLDSPFLTEADREEANHRPYLIPIKAQQIKDWELDNDGNFEWVKIEVARPTERAWNQSVDTTVRNYLIYSKDSWEEWEVRGETVQMTDQYSRTKTLSGEQVTKTGSGENPLGVVPLVIVRNEPDLNHEWFGLSAVRDISDINIAILNWSSLLDEEVYERCLNVLAMEDDGDPDSAVELSHANVLRFPQGSMHAPFYLSPGSTPMELIMKAVDRLKDEIYRLAKLGGDTGLQKSRAATSGIAYAFEFNTTNNALSKKAESAERAELEIHRLVALWMNETFEGSIAYPREFGVEDFLADLRLLTEARVGLSSETGIKELEKTILARMFARRTQELRDKMAGEVDETTTKGLLPSNLDIVGSLGDEQAELLNPPTQNDLGSNQDVNPEMNADSSMGTVTPGTE